MRNRSFSLVKFLLLGVVVLDQNSFSIAYFANLTPFTLVSWKLTNSLEIFRAVFAHRVAAEVAPLLRRKLLFSL